jgi:hypothetical protein
MKRAFAHIFLTLPHQNFMNPPTLKLKFDNHYLSSSSININLNFKFLLTPIHMAIAPTQMCSTLFLHYPIPFTIALEEFKFIEMIDIDPN